MAGWEEEWGKQALPERLVDDESLGDPRFIQAGWETMEHFIREGNEEAMGRMAEEMNRSWKQGHNIFNPSREEK